LPSIALTLTDHKNPLLWANSPAPGARNGSRDDNSRRVAPVSRVAPSVEGITPGEAPRANLRPVRGVRSDAVCLARQLLALAVGRHAAVHLRRAAITRPARRTLLLRHRSNGSRAHKFAGGAVCVVVPMAPMYP
jgi:hypothetical protein